MNNNKFTCIETFCGAGGLGLGLKRAGFKLLWGFDFDDAAVKTYSKNVCKRVSVEDAVKISPSMVLERAGVKKGEVTLLSGGPPCQGFSKQKNKVLKTDKRNRLVVKYIRLVQGIEPYFFLFENVDAFQKKRGENYLKLIYKGLESVYDIKLAELNFANYGVPQVRRRTIAIGVRKNLNIIYDFPKPTHLPEQWVSVGAILRQVPSPPEDGSQHPTLCNHIIAKITDLNKERISYVPQGSGRNCLPRRLQLPCHKKKTGWPDVYGRMSLDKPAPTITGGFDNFTRGRFAHPLDDRPITAREAALLQTFDLNFEFFGTRDQVRRQIGNAVPPRIGEILGRSIINALKKRTKDMK